MFLPSCVRPADILLSVLYIFLNSSCPHSTRYVTFFQLLLLYLPPALFCQKILNWLLENREGEHARALGRYQNVFLSAGELTELQSDFPTVWQEYIERLSEYMASTGRTYKSHAATIRRWRADDRRKTAPPARDRDYSVKDGDTV